MLDYIACLIQVRALPKFTIPKIARKSYELPVKTVVPIKEAEEPEPEVKMTEDLRLMCLYPEFDVVPKIFIVALMPKLQPLKWKILVVVAVYIFTGYYKNKIRFTKI